MAIVSSGVNFKRNINKGGVKDGCDSQLRVAVGRYEEGGYNKEAG